MTDGEQRKPLPASRLSQFMALFSAEPVFSDTFGAVMAASFVLVVGGLDVILPPELSLKPLYVGGVIAATLCGGSGFGLSMAFFGWGFSVMESLLSTPHLDVPPEWIIRINLGSDLAYMLIAFALALWGGQAFLRERRLSRTDILTGAFNRLGFQGILEYELKRHLRSKTSLTVAYMDCDNFKQINDTFGHEEGDALLRQVSRTMQATLRRTDCVARLGGDEFALILVDTQKAEAEVVIEKMTTLLIAEMQAHHWDVTFSIGAVTFTQPKVTVDEALRLADCTMYGVKHGGKAGAAFIEDTDVAIFPNQRRETRLRTNQAH